MSPSLERMLQRIEWIPFAFVGLIYASGFVVVTHFHSRLHLPTSDFLRVKYLTAGLYYVVLTGSVLVVVYYAASYIAGLPKYRSNREASLPGLPLYAIPLVAALIMLPILVFFFSYPGQTTYVVSYFLLFWVATLVGVTILRLKTGVPAQHKRTKAADWVRRIFTGLVWFVGLDILISLEIVDIVLIDGRFYFIFASLLGLIIGLLPQFQRLAKGFYHGERLLMVGPPALIAVLLYLSLVTFALTLYDRIPATRGGGERECVALVWVDGSREAREVGVLLDARGDGMYITDRVTAEGEVDTIRVRQLKDVRSWTYLVEKDRQPRAKYPGQGYARFFGAGARGWGRSFMEVFKPRNWLKECPP